MQTIADIILACGALGVAFYCFVLSRRLRRFNNLEHGVGGAVAVLSAQVDDLNRALDEARAAAETSGSSLAELTARAESVARRLELNVAAMHDLAEAPSRPRQDDAAPAFVEPAAPQPAPPAVQPAVARESSAFAPAGREAVDPPAPAAPPAPAVPAARPVRSFFASTRNPEAAL